MSINLARTYSRCSRTERGRQPPEPEIGPAGRWETWSPDTAGPVPPVLHQAPYRNQAEERILPGEGPDPAPVPDDRCRPGWRGGVERVALFLALGQGMARAVVVWRGSGCMGTLATCGFQQQVHREYERDKKIIRIVIQLIADISIGTYTRCMDVQCQ